MSGIGDTPRLATFLVRRRTALMVLTAVLAVLSVWAIPRVRINSDVTTYLPADSPMREGLSIVAEHLPGLDIRRQILRLEFPGEEPSDTLQAAIEALLVDPQLPEIRSSGDAAYYQYSLPRDTDDAALKAAVQARFGDIEKTDPRVREQGLQPALLQQGHGMNRFVFQGRGEVFSEQRPGAVPQGFRDHQGALRKAFAAGDLQQAFLRQFPAHGF